MEERAKGRTLLFPTLTGLAGLCDLLRSLELHEEVLNRQFGGRRYHEVRDCVAQSVLLRKTLDEDEVLVLKVKHLSCDGIQDFGGCKGFLGLGTIFQALEI